MRTFCFFLGKLFNEDYHNLFIIIFDLCKNPTYICSSGNIIQYDLFWLLVAFRWNMPFLHGSLLSLIKRQWSKKNFCRGKRKIYVLLAETGRSFHIFNDAFSRFTFITMSRNIFGFHNILIIMRKSFKRSWKFLF